jgi:hypothetical protein
MTRRRAGTQPQYTERERAALRAVAFDASARQVAMLLGTSIRDALTWVANHESLAGYHNAPLESPIPLDRLTFRSWLDAESLRYRRRRGQL